ncbi:MAG TPA: YdcF family protein [Elusimicrobiota bacterium]|jgi:uncharacterized SAM-binding protein YcdF (DUF218 family)|nr:YdcF family protein [Elusimicrobiota bacterium]
MRVRGKALTAVLLALLAAASALLARRAIGWWIDSSDQPVKSDILVVLAGDYSRPVFAAKLYARGYAPDVWISRPERDPALVELERYGIHLPQEDELDRKILVIGGVPETRIHLYGRDVGSTADEADALRREFPPAGKKILIVTSRFHARRARLIFRRLLPGADIRVVAEPYPPNRIAWWKDKDLVGDAILEPLKTIFFLTGGRLK